jgi:prepilin-type N-terminal cleavage/methylation domain-containing protein
MRRPINKQGFTIIEIMIVLAIAGLILLIVFLAIPALERSTRNTERKHDASLIATNRELYDEENGDTSMAAAEGTCTGNPTDEGGFAKFCNYITQGLIYYTPDEITLINNDYTLPTTIPTTTTNTVISETYLLCNATLSGATTTNAGPTDAVVLYALELTNGQQANQCLPSEVVTH